jgi:hypothetical protein
MHAILARNGGSIITCENYMQHHVIVACIAMMLVNKPVIGAYVQLDIAERLRFLAGKKHNGIVYIRPGRAAWSSCKKQLTGLTITQRQVQANW